MGGPVSRRSFVKRSALLAAVAAGGGVAGGPARARRPRNDLSPARERTYRALVGTVAGADRAYVDRTTADFRAWYRASPAHLRASVDATIDSAGRCLPARFARLPRARRAETLCTATPSAVAAHAVALARLPMAAEGRCAPGAV